MALSRNEQMELELVRRIAHMRRARQSILEFITFTFPGYKINWHHVVICDAVDEFVEGRIPYLMVNTPPRHGKSEIISRRLPPYLFGRYPSTEIILSSYAASLAERMSNDAQRIIESDAFGQVFPDVYLSGSAKCTDSERRKKWKRSAELFEIVRHMGSMRSVGIGGALTGMGGIYGLLDDPIKDRADADSETIREKTWDYITSTFWSRLEERAQVCLTQTRWHEEDPAGKFLDLMDTDPDAPKWHVLSLPAIIETEEDMHDYDPREMGDVLWPEKRSLEQLMKIKALSARDWASLWQQRPFVEGGEVVKKTWWRYFDPIELESKLGKYWHEQILSVDATFKDTKTADYVSAGVWKRYRNDKYRVDQFREKLGFTGTIEAILRILEKHPKVKTVIIEDKANGSAIIDVLKSKLVGYHIIAYNPTESKLARAWAVSPAVEAGNVWLPAPKFASWVDNYINEWAKFPNGKHDDQVDETSQALLRLGRHEKFDIRNFKD